LALLQLFKNGSFVSQGPVWVAQGTPTGVVASAGISDSIFLAKGDYVDLRGYNEGSVSTNTDGITISIEEDPDFTVFAALSDRLTNLVSKSANYTALGSDSTIVFTADATLSLPAAADYRGKTYFVTSSGTGTDVTIDPNASETVCGQTTIQVSGERDGVEIQSDGTNWIGLNGACVRNISVSGTFNSTSIAAQDGNCVSSISAPGAGQSGITFVAACWSAAPRCSATADESTSSNMTTMFAGIPTTGAVTIRGRVSGTLTNGLWNMVCRGPR